MTSNLNHLLTNVALLSRVGTVVEMEGHHSTIACGGVGVNFDHLIFTKRQQGSNGPGNKALSS
jgi:uncharacterized protein YpiB (UPF0302 family)